MVANLYLHPDTFLYNGSDTEETIACKLVSLVDDMKDIIYSHKNENKFKVSTLLARVSVYKTCELVDFASKVLDGDQLVVFYTMLTDTSDSHDFSMQDLRNMCKYEKNETEINSIVVFNIPIEYLDDEQKAICREEAKMKHLSVIKDYITFDEYKVVYNKQSWHHLRRQILGNHPGTPKEFMHECEKYFPAICFHENCIESLNDRNYEYLNYIPRKIVYYLSCLNDEFSKYYSTTANKNPNDILSGFSGIYGFDEAGSMQQNKEKKPLLTFNFCNKDKSCRCDSCLCEPHLKISQPDKKHKGGFNAQNFHPRIYFSFTCKKNKIPVASIGKHI